MITLERKPYQMIIVKMEPYPILSQIKQIVTFGIVIVYQIMLFWKKTDSLYFLLITLWVDKLPFPVLAS